LVQENITSSLRKLFTNFDDEMSDWLYIFFKCRNWENQVMECKSFFLAFMKWYEKEFEKSVNLSLSEIRKKYAYGGYNENGFILNKQRQAFVDLITGKVYLAGEWCYLKDVKIDERFVGKKKIQIREYTITDGKVLGTAYFSALRYIIGGRFINSVHIEKYLIEFLENRYWVSRVRSSEKGTFFSGFMSWYEEMYVHKRN